MNSELITENVVIASIGAIVTVIVTVSNLIISLLSLRASKTNSKKIDDVHKTVNGNMENAIKDAKKLGEFEAIEKINSLPQQ